MCYIIREEKQFAVAAYAGGNEKQRPDKKLMQSLIDIGECKAHAFKL